jgi:hypothetical protein
LWKSSPEPDGGIGAAVGTFAVWRSPRPAELTGILERLGSTAERWQARLEKLKGGRLLGRFFAATRGRLREVAARMKVHHLANLGGCPAV